MCKGEELISPYSPLSVSPSLSSGTTWVSYILDLLYFGETSPERQTSIPIYERVPFLDIAFPSMDTGCTDTQIYLPYFLSMHHKHTNTLSYSLSSIP